MNSLAQRIGIALVLILGMLVGGIAGATPIVMDFDGLNAFPIGEAVHNYYDGGCAAIFGIIPVDCTGPDYGVVWKDAFVGAAPGAHGSPNAMRLLTTTSATMNVAAGFHGGLSFYYYASVFSGSATVYSGLDATGTVLASLGLSGAGGCGLFCWDPVSMAFGDIAHSVVFGGFPVLGGFDDVAIDVGARAPVPGPPALGMFGLGVLLLGGFVALRRRALDT